VLVRGGDTPVKPFHKGLPMRNWPRKNLGELFVSAKIREFMRATLPHNLTRNFIKRNSVNL
jgi:hypothetical protein